MFQISVKAYPEHATRMLRDVHKRHIPFAAVYAATLSARRVKDHEKLVMGRVFDKPTPYVMNALRVKPATKADPVASVEFKDFAGKGTPAKRFLNPNVHGGGRSQKSHERQLAALLGSTFLVPGKDMPRDAYGNMRASEYTRILSRLGVSQAASTSKRSKAKAKKLTYFVAKGMVLKREGSKVTPALIPIRAPNYRKIFPFYEEAHKVVARHYPQDFKTALERAIATSNYKGKWK